MINSSAFSPMRVRLEAVHRLSASREMVWSWELRRHGMIES
ncbi:hypothetical protein [Nocardia sp. JMUB6875]